jgi:hypothetical protein
MRNVVIVVAASCRKLRPRATLPRCYEMAIRVDPVLRERATRRGAMKRMVQIVAAGGMLASATMFSANDAAAACWTAYVNGSQEYCQKRCDSDIKNSADFFDRYWFACKYGQAHCAPGNVSSDVGGSCCPVGRRPTHNLLTCSATLDQNRPTSWCLETMCDSPAGQGKVRRKVDTSKYTVPKPHVGPPQPGTNSSSMDRLQGVSPSAPVSSPRDQAVTPSGPATTSAPSTPATPNAPSPLYNKSR